jgi:hypothetical protein
LIQSQIVTKVVRCSLTDRNQCDGGVSFTLPDVCALRDNFQIVADIILGPVMALEPKIDCAKSTQWKGTYVIRNYTLDLQAAKILPIDGFFWKLEDMRSYGGNEDLLCTNVEAVVRNVLPRR